MAVGVLAWDYQRGAAKDEVKKAKELEYRAGVDEHFSEIKDVSSSPPLLTPNSLLVFICEPLACHPIADPPS